ncbi:MAG TPA: patatin-like phospholipase family protein [Chitinophagaceae bacterium]|jgi:NTE family protein|nr:patatin-like phospholipase family protein [Chitinophagaceae bacterium]
MASKITTADFLQQSGVDRIITKLRADLEKNNKKLVVSDVTDAEGNQYVDLVQEGGGVLGIALVGYTYVLEKMGIRFFSMAGTSAGSINAMLLACAGNKEDEKSSVITDHLVKLDMFSFVDGKSGNWGFTKWIKKIVQRMLMGNNIIRRIFLFISWLFIFLLYLTLSCFLVNFFEPGVAKWFGVAAFATLLAVVIIVVVAATKFKSFAKNGYGLNEGKAFHQWIKDLISSFHIQADPKQSTINNYADFSSHFMRIPALKVDPDPRRTNNEAPLMPMLTLITCDIIANRKVEFTQMWDLYWEKEEDVHPGDFVRASMSIPVFFETYTLTDIKKKSSFATWDRHLNWQNEKKDIPDKVQFIDGGTLSNFPINVFYNPNYPVPRMPTFGIRLQDGVLDTARRNNNTLPGYLASLFSTIRFNFDRDFITKNRAFNRGVKNIDVQEHSWLNFFMQDKEKIELFRKGAQAAADFLLEFDWAVYKNERAKNHEMREELFEDPNNMKVFPYSQR